jgi:hypothetical protein
MKIRIKDNSIRYRLTKTEVDNFGKTGHLESKTEFLNGAAFYYSLEKKKDITDLEASFSNNRISILVPEKIAEEWITTDIVGFDHKMKTGDDKELFLLIEKDFVCLDHTFEDQSDNYPNPNKVCSPGQE